MLIEAVSLKYLNEFFSTLCSNKTKWVVYSAVLWSESVKDILLLCGRQCLYFRNIAIKILPTSLPFAFVSYVEWKTFTGSIGKYVIYNSSKSKIGCNDINNGNSSDIRIAKLIAIYRCKLTCQIRFRSEIKKFQYINSNSKPESGI